MAARTWVGYNCLPTHTWVNNIGTADPRRSGGAWTYDDTGGTLKKYLGKCRKTYKRSVNTSVIPLRYINYRVMILFGPGYLSRYTEYATGWTVRESNPGGCKIFRTCPYRLWGPPSLLYNGYQVFPGVKERPGRDADPHPLLVPLVMDGYSYTSTPPMGNFTFTF